MKPCPFCAEEIQDAAIKCRYCGSMLTDAPPTTGVAPRTTGVAPPTTGVAPRPATPPAPETPAEEVLRARPSWKAQFASHVAAVTLIVGGIALGIALTKVWNQSVQTGVIMAAIISGVGEVWLIALWFARAVHYKITTRTIDIESGVLTRRIDTIQLWKVRDLQFHQSLLERMLGLMRIRVFTGDVTTPQVQLWGLPASRPAFERLKDATELARQGRNVVGLVE